MFRHTVTLSGTWGLRLCGDFLTYFLKTDLSCEALLAFGCFISRLGK